MRLARDALQRSEESAELLAEKSMVAEQVIIIVVIIIITRPKPAYGREVLAVSWGQDADEVSTFLGVLNVSLRA